MQVELLIGKLHQAAVTECRLHYQGSISLDMDLVEQVGLLPYQKVDVYNINNGARFSTYILPGPRGGCEVGVNGAAARLCQVGDRLIIVGFGSFSAEEAADHTPRVVVLDESNQAIPKA